MSTEDSGNIHDIVSIPEPGSKTSPLVDTPSESEIKGGVCYWDNRVYSEGSTICVPANPPSSILKKLTCRRGEWVWEFGALC